MRPCPSCGEQPTHVETKNLYCKPCRKQYRKTARLTKVEAFWAKVNLHGPDVGLGLGECWEWTGYTADDYGKFGYDGGTLAHRFSFLISVGPIPDELELDHLCRNKICVRPTHLEPVTHEENMRRRRGFPYKKREKVLVTGV